MRSRSSGRSGQPESSERHPRAGDRPLLAVVHRVADLRRDRQLPAERIPLPVAHPAADLRVGLVGRLRIGVVVQRRVPAVGVDVADRVAAGRRRCARTPRRPGRRAGSRRRRRWRRRCRASRSSQLRSRVGVTAACARRRRRRPRPGRRAARPGRGGSRRGRGAASSAPSVAAVGARHPADGLGRDRQRGVAGVDAARPRRARRREGAATAFGSQLLVGGPLRPAGERAPRPRPGRSARRGAAARAGGG